MIVCENLFCVYQECGMCRLAEIKIDRQGHCGNFICVETDEEEISKLKAAQLKRYKKYKVKPD